MKILVTRDAARDLMLLISDFSYIRERCRSACEITPYQSIHVKGENYILEVLKRQFPIIEDISNTFESIKTVKEAINRWIIYLEQRYSDKWQPLGPPILLQIEDAKKLQKEVRSWKSIILKAYATPGTEYIKQYSLKELFTEDILSTIDDFTKDDLNDALKCILHLIPTPAAIISLRAVERIIRNLYSKLMCKSPSYRDWKDLLVELEQAKKLKDTLIGYIQYLRDKRNEAAHPDKRFTQEESERILLYIKGSLEEIQKI